MASRFCDASVAGVVPGAGFPLTVTTVTAYSLENICCLSGNNREPTLTPTLRSGFRIPLIPDTTPAATQLQGVQSGCKCH
jgi:hypothetical protein